MTLGLREERLDAAIVAFLDELSRDTSDAPSTAEMAIGVSRWPSAGSDVARALAGAPHRGDPDRRRAVGAGRRLGTSKLTLHQDLHSFHRRAPSRPGLVRQRQPAPAGVDLAAVTLTPAHERPSGQELAGTNTRMAYGYASWVKGCASPSHGVVVLQGAGDVAPVTLADVTWPNGRPNATWSRTSLRMGRRSCCPSANRAA